ncbi:hypothetical protein [Mycoplasma sp. OR1901]|uniref:hypothetical protein n=1 Tax=Mycoplasma sp. OR1901 TaxID=2742195 RepID=UPI00158236DC|nr:hypothetical protein [Mycoplasma sp. OR1901]QKT05392.1 hypothetical protein HTZ87_01600 [Mycoplasma sp. OR1901]
MNKFLAIIASSLSLVALTSCASKPPSNTQQEVKEKDESKLGIEKLKVYEDLDFNNVKDSEQTSFELDSNIVEYKKTQFHAFIKDIKETARDESPTFYFNRNAGQVWNTSMQHAIALLNYSNKINNDKTKVVYVGDHDVLKNDNRFNLNYLQDKYQNSVDILNNDLKISDGKFSYIHKTEKTNSNSTPENYSIIPTKSFLEYVFKPFLESDQNNKFNIVIPDISFTGLKPDAREYLIKHAKKIVIISDGNAQLAKFIPQYFYYVSNKDQPHDIETVSETFETKEDINKINAREYYRLEDKVKIFNYQGNYSLSLNNIFDLLDKSWAKINVHSYPTSLNKLNKEGWLSDTDYLNDILITNNLMENDNNNTKKSINDLMILNSDKYDENKKNMVFMGSSLFRKGAYTDNEKLRENAIDYFEKIEKLYPRTEYNYLFKLHPYYKPDQSLDYVKMLLGKEDVSDYIILNPSISWENMLSLDYSNLESGSNESIFFKKEKNKIVPNMKLFTLQATTTVLISTMQFIEQTLKGYDSLDSKREVVDPSIIPLNEEINIINRENIENKDYYEINYDNLYNIYKWNLTSNDFYPITEFKRLSEFLKDSEEE